jgi:hypothetical protein
MDMFSYLEAFIWPDGISRWIQQRIIKLYENLGESAIEALAKIG